MARFAHLGEISRSRRYMLGRAQSLAIAIDRIDRFSYSQNRGVASVASGRWWSRHGVAASHPRCGARL